MTPERLAELERLAKSPNFQSVRYEAGIPLGPGRNLFDNETVADLTAHIRDLEAQLAAARDIINEIRSEAQRTIDWNQTRGMRPATDTSMFTGSYGAAVRVARMITAAYAAATSPEVKRCKAVFMPMSSMGGEVCTLPHGHEGQHQWQPPSPEVGA